jgi:CxxC motif-containing protein
MGCQISVDMEDGKVLKITGNTCKRGEIYAAKEVVSPTRVVTTTVKVDGGDLPVVSVKTEKDIPKGKIFDVMAAVEEVHVKAPVAIGDVILPDVAGTGVNIVATKNIAKVS